MKINTKTSSVPKKYLTFEEAADYLSVSISTLYKYTSNNVIPFHEINGKKKLISIKDLDSYMESKRVKSDNEVNLTAKRKSISLF